MDRLGKQTMRRDEITHGDSFKLLNEVEDGSINLLLTDPPYFLNPELDVEKPSGVGGGVEWDDINKLFKYREDLQKEYESSATSARKEQIHTILKEYYFNMLIASVEPKMAPDSTMIIFNRLENVNYMRSSLKKYTYGVARSNGIKVTEQAADNVEQWDTTGTFEWDKTNPVPVVAPPYQSEYALIALNSIGMNDGTRTAKNATINYVDNFTIDNSFRTAHPIKNHLSPLFGENTGHLTPKPFNLWTYLMRRFSEPGDTVLDPFSGSGTTALVATDLNRHFYAMEMDDEQFSLSTQRLAQFKQSQFYSVFPD